jgi:hypothetical protein
MIHGRCLCGAVKLTAEEVKPKYSACHCGMCRRWSGGSPFFALTAKGLRFASEDDVGRYASSDWAERGFCKKCGTPLFYFLQRTGQYFVSTGVFEDQTPFQLTLEIFIDNKPPGYALAGDHPRWTESETLERMKPPA